MYRFSCRYIGRRQLRLLGPRGATVNVRTQEVFNCFSCPYLFMVLRGLSSAGLVMDHVLLSSRASRLDARCEAPAGNNFPKRASFALITHAGLVMGVEARCSSAAHREQLIGPCISSWRRSCVYTAQGSCIRRWRPQDTMLISSPASSQPSKTPLN